MSIGIETNIVRHLRAALTDAMQIKARGLAETPLAERDYLRTVGEYHGMKLAISLMDEVEKKLLGA